MSHFNIGEMIILKAKIDFIQTDSKQEILIIMIV
jgi:hypothetical protein